ncbi:MAG TPA: hypothetical protein EYQ27_09525 [Gemmatimonadetes bacterium]|nr:hypothetical protein [Gemmatimonadota bacterium]
MGPGALDYYSLGDGLLRPSPGGPLGMARPPVMPLRDDTPLVESGSFGLYSGAYGWAGNIHSLPTGDLLGDDPRYQALLEEAGITW